MCAAAASIKKQLLQVLTLPACRRRGGGGGACGLNDDTLMNKEVPSVRYYQQFVLRSYTFHASYLLQHYYIAATSRSEPLSTSRAKNVKPARSGCALASAMIKIENKQVRTCRLWWWLTARSMIICTLIPNGISRDDALLNGHFQVLSSSIPEIVTPFLNYDALPKKKTLHHGKDQVLAHPWKKETKIYPSLTNTRR